MNMRCRKYVAKKLFGYAIKMWPENPDLIKFVSKLYTDAVVTGMSVVKVDYTKMDLDNIWKDIAE